MFHSRGVCFPGTNEPIKSSGPVNCLPSCRAWWGRRIILESFDLRGDGSFHVKGGSWAHQIKMFKKEEETKCRTCRQAENRLETSAGENLIIICFSKESLLPATAGQRLLFLFLSSQVPFSDLLEACFMCVYCEYKIERLSVCWWDLSGKPGWACAFPRL